MELKYKVWDKEQKKMLVISFENEEDRYNRGKAILNYSTQNGIYATLSGYRDEDGNPYEIDAEILPYTGVKDINKKESYLGDILKQPKPRYGELSDREKEEFGIVKKEEDSNNMYVEWNFETVWNGKVYWDTTKEDITAIRTYEVVGNIFENENMIKKENKTK